MLLGERSPSRFDVDFQPDDPLLRPIFEAKC